MSGSSRVSGKYAAGQVLAIVVVAVIALPFLPLILLVLAWIRLRDRLASSRESRTAAEGNRTAPPSRPVPATLTSQPTRPPHPDKAASPSRL